MVFATQSKMEDLPLILCKARLANHSLDEKLDKYMLEQARNLADKSAQDGGADSSDPIK